MDKNQKIVVALLIIAILFSVVSIIIAVGIANVDLSQLRKPTYVYKYTKGDTGPANVGLIVEASTRSGK